MWRSSLSSRSLVPQVVDLGGQRCLDATNVAADRIESFCSFHLHPGRATILASSFTSTAAARRASDRLRAKE